MTIQERLDDLHKRMLAVSDEMTSLGKQARDEKDQAKASGIRSVFAGKQTEFNALKAEFEDLKTQAETQRVMDEVKGLAKTDTQGKTMNPDDQPGAKVVAPPNKVDPPIKDAAKNELEYIEHFLGWSSGKSLSDRALDQIAVKPGTRLYALDQNAVLLPKSMSHRIITGAKTMLSTDATGGATDSGSANLIAPNFIPQVITVPIYAPTLYDMVRRVPAANGRATYPKLDITQGNFGGVAFTWKATEGLDKGETQPVFGTWEVLTHEVSGWTAISLQALRRSAIDLEAFLTELFRTACHYEFSRVILNGNGTTQPQGILVAAINTVSRLVANQVSYQDLVNVSYGVKKGLRVGSIFVVADGVEQYLMGEVDGLGRPLFTPSISTGPVDRLTGYRYEVQEFVAPVIGSEGDVVFGNLGYYGFGVEEDIAIAKSEHAEFKKGLVVFRLMAHVGGKPQVNQAFCALN